MNIKEAYQQLNYSDAPESDQVAKQWLADVINSHGSDDLEGDIGHFINGEIVCQANTAVRLPVVDPSSGEHLADISCADSQLVDSAVQAAAAAYPQWQALGDGGRAKVLYAIARGIQRHAKLFAVLETLDNGKPIRESRDADIPLVIRHFYHHAGWAALRSQTFPHYESIGVVGQIIPWNFPLLMLAWKIAPALAMGNTLVLKPAEQTPLTARLFAQICQEAGVPIGVVNIVNGAGDTGVLLSEHAHVGKIAFTGSTEVGKCIRRGTAGQHKKLSLELGGKSAFIVFEDADLDAAVEGLVDSIWFNQGEVCCAGSRLLVQASVEAQFLAKVKQRMASLRRGAPLDKSVDIGSLVSARQFEQVCDKITAGMREGGDIYQYGEIDKSTNYYPPTLITDVETSHPLVAEEIFGPVLVAMSFRTQGEAVELANNSRYGLAASIWTENINLAYDAAPKLKAGVVWINCHNQFDAAAGFGGIKESGFGREGGQEGLYEYLLPAHLVAPTICNEPAPRTQTPTSVVPASGIDRTLKFYIGGKQVRPDSGYSMGVYGVNGDLLTHVGFGNRKDIRNAVSAAVKAAHWGNTRGHLRAQILYYLAENMASLSTQWIDQLQVMTAISAEQAQTEFDASMDRLFVYAAWADKYDGRVHDVPYRGVTMAMREAKGVIGLLPPSHQPLLSLISILAPAIAMGNTVVLVPASSVAALALMLVPHLETSDIPAGVVNIVAGNTQELGTQLAGHAQVNAVWCWGDDALTSNIELVSAEDLKSTWCHREYDRDWVDDRQGQGEEFLRQATEVKNVWTPYGD